MVNHLRRLAGVIACRLGRHDSVPMSHYTAAEASVLLIAHYPGVRCRRCGHVDNAATVPDPHPASAPWNCTCDRSPLIVAAIKSARPAQEA